MMGPTGLRGFLIVTLYLFGSFQGFGLGFGMKGDKTVSASSPPKRLRCSLKLHVARAHVLKVDHAQGGAAEPIGKHKQTSESI